MSNVKISALPTGTVGSTDAFPIVQGGVTKAATFGHTHPQSDVTDLTTDLAGKAAASHTHAESDVTSLVSDLAGKAATSHTHAESDVTNLVTDLANLQAVAFIPLDQSGWAWVNQGAAVVKQGTRTVRLTLASEASENIRGRFIAAPSTPYTITALIYAGPLNTTGLCNVGLAFREVSSQKIVYVAYAGNSNGAGPKFHVRKNTNATTNSSDVQSNPFIAASPTWVRIADTGTTITLSYSFDGENFTSLVSETRATFFTTAPDQVGIVIQNFGANIEIGGSIVSWVQA